MTSVASTLSLSRAYGHLVAAARIFPGHPPKNESGGPEVFFSDFRGISCKIQ
jgi:hypothetical protein